MNWDTELQRLELLRAIGPEHAARLDIVYPDANPTVLATTVRAAGGDTRSQLLTMFREAARWIPTAGGMSNSWVVSGERTTSGRPILCNDPHLVPGMPSIWYAAHVQAGDDFESTGVTMPGMPFVIIGHNKRIAWGFTNSFADCQDLVIEEFDSPAADRFRTERGFEPTRRLREIIHVKNSSDVLEEVVVTRHGPVVERIEDPERAIWRGLALQWTALQPGGAAEGLLRLQRAGDWKSFKEAFTTFDAPSQNVVYADVDGHIGYLLSGRIPVRRAKPSGLPVQGWTGNAVWTRYLTIDEVPADLRSSRAPDHHGQQSHRRRQLPLLHRQPTTCLATAPCGSASCSASGWSIFPTWRVPRWTWSARPHARSSVCWAGCTATNPAAESARHRLAQWDAVMDPRRVEPTIYEAFMARLAEHSLSPDLRQRLAHPCGRRPVAPGLPVPGQPGRPAHAVAHRALGARRRRSLRRPDDLGGGDHEVARRRDDRSPQLVFGSRLATLDVGPRAPARAHPRVRAPSRTGAVLQRPVDQGWRQHRHRAGDVGGSRRAVRDPAVGPVVAPGHRRGQMGRERRHPPSRAVGPAGIPSLPRSVPPLADQPAVPAVLESPGGAPPRSDPADPPSGAPARARGARGANIVA